MTAHPELDALLAKLETQLNCADLYAIDAKPDTEYRIPSVWQLQNQHIRDILGELRAYALGSADLAHAQERIEGLRFALETRAVRVAFDSETISNSYRCLLCDQIAPRRAEDIQHTDSCLLYTGEKL